MELIPISVIVLIYLGFAVWAIRWAWTNPQASTGWRAACFVAGGLMLLSCAGAPVVLYPVFRSAREAKNLWCLSNLQAIGKAFLMYQGEHGTLPVGEWTSALVPYAPPESFACPMLSEPFGYTANENLVGINLESMRNPAEVVFAFDGVGGANRTDGVDGIRWRHDGETAMFLFADGHTRRVREAAGPPNFSPSGK